MTTRFLAIVATAVSLACATVPAAAQGLPGVATIDLQRIQRDSSAAKSIKGQIDKQMAAHQQEITKQENELRNAEQELNKQRTLISPEAFNERRRQFEQKVGNLQRDVQNRKRDVGNSAVAAERVVEQALKEVVEQIVTERKLTLVMRKELTVYAASEFEITDEVMKRLNAKLPSVKVTAPPKAPAAAPKAPGK